MQLRTQRLAHDIARREELYKNFIEEASKLYVDAFEHNENDLSKLVGLYALISRMRVLSSPRIVEHADKVARVVIETYLGPNRTFRDVLEIMDNESMNPLRQFGEACREELERFGRY